jgi:hypothetical protein
MQKFDINIEAVLMTPDPNSFVTASLESIEVDLGGIPNDRHYGLLRCADVRQKFYPKGTLIANRRQLTVVSVEECAEIAARLGVPKILPEWLGANMLISGYPDLTLLPQGARFIFTSGAGLICEGDNPPCLGPGKIIEAFYVQPELKARFVAEADNRRGIVCSVECPGIITNKQKAQILIP